MPSVHWRWMLLLVATGILLGFLLGARNLKDLLDEAVMCPDPARQEAPGHAGAVDTPLDLSLGMNTGFGFYPCGYQHFVYTEQAGPTTRSITVSSNHDIGWELYTSSSYLGVPLTTCDFNLGTSESCTTTTLRTGTPYYLVVISYENVAGSGDSIQIQ